MALQSSELQSEFVVKAGKLHGTIRWNIPDFKNWMAARNFQKPILSPLIEIKSSPTRSVRLQVSSGSTSCQRLTSWSQNDSSIRFSLKNCNTQDFDVLAFQATVPFIEAQGYPFPKFKAADESFPAGTFSSILSFARRNSHLLIFEGNNLQLTIEMSLEHRPKDLGTDQSFVGSLFQDLRPELEADPPIFSDAVLVCQGQEFHCHKLFLAARYSL